MVSGRSRSGTCGPRHPSLRGVGLPAQSRAETPATQLFVPIAAMTCSPLWGVAAGTAWRLWSSGLERCGGFGRRGLERSWPAQFAARFAVPARWMLRRSCACIVGEMKSPILVVTLALLAGAGGSCAIQESGPGGTCLAKTGYPEAFDSTSPIPCTAGHACGPPAVNTWYPSCSPDPVPSPNCGTISCSTGYCSCLDAAKSICGCAFSY